MLNFEGGSASLGGLQALEGGICSKPFQDQLLGAEYQSNGCLGPRFALWPCSAAFNLLSVSLGTPVIYPITGVRVLVVGLAWVLNLEHLYRWSSIFHLSYILIFCCRLVKNKKWIFKYMKNFRKLNWNWMTLIFWERAFVSCCRNTTPKMISLNNKNKRPLFCLVFYVVFKHLRSLLCSLLWYLIADLLIIITHSKLKFC